MPKGYIYAEFDIIDPEGWAKYVPLAQASLSQFQARYVVRGGDPEVLEGGSGTRRISILEFESREKARQWYESPEYQAARAVREKAATVYVMLLSGAET